MGINLSSLNEAFWFAFVGALAVVAVGGTVAFVKWLGRINVRFHTLDERITILEHKHEGPSMADLDDRMRIVERDRGPVLGVVNTRLDSLDERVGRLEHPPPPPRPPQPRRRK